MTPTTRGGPLNTSEPTAALHFEDAALRDEEDADPVVEQMVARLRTHLGSLNAVDEWGRPMAWRNVVRLALGPLAARLRDADTAAALADAITPAYVPMAVRLGECVPARR